MDKKILIQKTKVELARRKFFNFCNLLQPKFYRKDRKYLVDLCNTLQDFYEKDEEDILIINEPPRHGKSFTSQLFTEWVLGKNKDMQIMTASYNTDLSTGFSKKVRDNISMEKVDKYIPVYNDVFPHTKIKYGDSRMDRWSIEGSYNNYLATSPNGTATGFGCKLMIIDDVIKNSEEAHNSTIKEKHFSWFTDTMLSRLECGGKIIIIMTRWASDDLAGRILQWCKDTNKKYKHINMKAINDDNTMLCDSVLSYNKALELKSLMGADIFSANYQQIPIDLEGRLYSHFKTYESKPNFNRISAYIDTADKGSDYLCCIIYGEYNNEAYVLDVVHTQAKMELTEGIVAKRLYENGVNKCKIEGNNGGEGFSRSVERILRERYNSNQCVISTFHQSKNKEARILSNATWIEEHIYYPINWNSKWQSYYEAMFNYQASGKNKHDDAPDATTGVAEQFNGKRKGRAKFYKI